MSRSSFVRRRAAAWVAVLVVAGACTAGVDRMVGPGSVAIDAPSLVVVNAPSSGVVISQVYGGGGNSGATYRNDFVELYNGSASDVSVEGWTVQYASSTGTSWQTTTLHGTIGSGHYYLVQEGAGSGGTASLPTPDALGGIAMSATAGKVALVSSGTALSGACPLNANGAIVDFVGFGAAANCFEGNAATATLANATATVRNDGGRQDTNDNGADFGAPVAPSPRNSASPVLPPKSVLSAVISPAAPVAVVGQTIAFTAVATKGGADVPVTHAEWTSSNTGVATIDAASGAATTVGTGSATIAVTVTTAQGTASATTTLSVAAAPAAIRIAPVTWSLKPGASRQFSATLTDAGGNPTTSPVSWTSTNPAVATVDATGRVLGVSYGYTFIIATTANGISDTARVDGSDIIVQARADALPLGFQTQLFLQSRNNVDRDGNAVGNSGVTWSSSNPDIVSVDPNTAVITAKKTGVALITALAKSDGVSSASTAVTVSVPEVSLNARVGHNTELGTPRDADPSDDYIIARRQYTLSYNPARGGPNWVSWNLDASHKGSVSRCNCFTADTAVTRLGFKAWDTADWINGGTWSRGHMAPSADWADSDGDNAPTFFLSNMLPQNQTMNAGAWGDLENRLRALATGSTEIYIVAGGIFTKDRSGPGVDGFGFMNSTGRIAVPDSVWKVAIVVPDGRPASGITSASDVQVIAVKMPNDATAGGTYDRYVTTIESVQRSTGYDLLSAIAEDVQCRVESRNCAPVARLGGPGLAGGDEGEALSFSAATSSDPEGDALSYRWTVDGVTAGSGPALTWTFGDEGSYTVSITVADPNGASSTASATVSVRNVAPTLGGFAGATILRGERYTAAGSFADPGDDSWSATVNYGDGSGANSLPLSGKSFALGHDYDAAGTFTVTVSVSDGDGGSDASSAQVVVQTPLEGVQNIANMLSSLGDAGAASVRGPSSSLNKGELNSLRVKLNAAAAALRRDDATPAANTLEAFLNELNAMVGSGRVSESAAAPIASYTRRVIASVNG
ncbi:MAG TPA: DNA/RNA non-specific endonuclease [Gemmatimonadaceae bacterium]